MHKGALSEYIFILSTIIYPHRHDCPNLQYKKFIRKHNDRDTRPTAVICNVIAHFGLISDVLVCKKLLHRPHRPMMSSN